MTKPEKDHIRHAVSVDRSDPFLSRRLATHARHGIKHVSYDKTRRMAAPIEQRFSLVSR